MKSLKLSAVALGLAVTCGIELSPAYGQDSDGYWEKIQQRGVLRCGAASAPPYIIRDPKTASYSGIFVDLCRQFGDQLGVKVEIVDTTWDNMVAGLQAGRWDVSMALNRTPRRALAVNYSEPVWDFRISALFDRLNPKFKVEPVSLKDIDKPENTVALVAGTAIDAAVTKKLRYAQVLRLPDIDSSRLALVSRRADILFEDADSNSIFEATNAQKWKSVHPNPPIAKQGIAFAVRLEAQPADLQALNIMIQNEVASGQVADLGKYYIEQLGTAMRR